MGLPTGQKRTFYRGDGCSGCFQTGYRGRTAVFEILPMTPEMRQAIHARSIHAMEQAVQRSTFRPMLEDALRLVEAGITTAEEVIRIIGRQEK